MKPDMPKNAYEVIFIRDKIKKSLDRIEKVKPDEYGCVLVDRSNMLTIKDELRQGIAFADCLLYMMSFNGDGE